MDGVAVIGQFTQFHAQGFRRTARRRGFLISMILRDFQDIQGRLGSDIAVPSSRSWIFQTACFCGGPFTAGRSMTAAAVAGEPVCRCSRSSWTGAIAPFRTVTEPGRQPWSLRCGARVALASYDEVVAPATRVERRTPSARPAAWTRLPPWPPHPVRSLTQDPRPMIMQIRIDPVLAQVGACRHATLASPARPALQASYGQGGDHR